MVTWTETWRAWRAGASLGDLAVLKFAWLAGPTDARSARLGAVGDGCLEVDMEALRALPAGTVGRAYARHLDESGLQPLRISPEIKRRFAADPYPLWYTTTHDLLHTLTGFPTTPAGEIGLFAFMIGQGFGSRGRGRLWQSLASYTLFMPLHAPGVWHNARVGLAMAKRARNLLEQPLGSFLARPLAEVRAELGLPDPRVVDIAPGRPSLLARWLMPKAA